jgi:uroporphyrin-III C-methyltransferase
MKTPKLTLIGAGPGDPDLITLKGAKALSTADVVLYDALVNREILEFVPLHAKKIYVGKRSNKHAYSQDEINELIVKHAYESGNVVRLKGGDPFVFGRGFEEIQYVTEKGVEAEYVPGISSSISVAGLQNIPVTHRGTSESFWVITGTKSDGSISEDIFTAAKTNATIVILMGLNKLQQIADIFIEEGKEDLSAAIIQNGSLSSENFVSGTIGDLPEIAKIEKIGAPAIIIIGEVVKLRDQLQEKLIELQYYN